ncbi:hypothetical protein F2Q70_00039791 [Brassica cretica]|uniref:Uncharacterized protein n=1 Tax=Brassica cretica TaxID=69181 RepID=A0A8S9K508_BRACR|nr:hypothetical protein F2Q70_00039791 [Brassica cretica]
MDIERELHMTDFARNSSVQKKASDKTKHITLETVQQLYKETRPKSLKIADLGCSSGPNTLSTIRDIIKAVKFAHHLEIPNQPLPEFSILLNDLPSNDFNSIFKSLPDFHTKLKRDTNYGDCPSVFIAANPGSFYGRLFPEKTIHFIYSSFSLHWLSKVPPGLYDDQGKSINKGCINICSWSPEAVSKAYCSQFKEDFSMFLRFRSKEKKLFLLRTPRKIHSGLDIDPMHVPSLISKAEILMELGNGSSIAVVRSFLMEALRIDRLNHTAWFILGKMFKAEGSVSSMQEAVECFQAAVTLEETMPVEPFR